MTNEERIKADAEASTNDHADALKANGMEYAPMIMRVFGYKEGYIAGATVENEKTEAVIDAAIHKERNALQAKVTQMDIDWLKRAQVLVDALEEIERRIKVGNAGAYYQIKMIRPVVMKALEQWKSGKGKEETKPEPEGCPYCGSATCTSDHK